MYQIQGTFRHTTRGDRKCFTMKSNIHGVDLGLRVDSAVPGIIAPLSSSSNDVGLAIQSISSGKTVTINYKGDEYNGISSTATVTIPGTRITGIDLPVILVEKQSAYLVGIDNSLKQGILGFGYSSLSDYYTSVTAMDVLYKNDVIPRNEVGIQLCPYEMLQESFINIGNTDITSKCGTDGNSVAWVESPSDGYFSVNIKDILIDDKPVNLPAGFQKKMEDGHTLYSAVETCSEYMHFPGIVVAALIDAIVGSNAITLDSFNFKHRLNNQQIKSLFWKRHLIAESYFNIKWDRLPTITITMFTETPVTDDNRNSVVEIKLGPRDYLQRYNSENLVFAVEVGSNYKATLGISFMTRLGLVFDRKHARIGFGPGCGCKVVTDGYPIISDGDQVLWSPSQFPEQPSGSGSDGTFIRRRKSKTTTDRIAVPKNVHHDKLD
ncbi:hypothetical protein BDEG_22536 [Batrachochytrium dendrobatidis JEL423]|uniref:Peptidase A1 domain-containing protein n=1 Tax=Batrachochytrium dendrobatidis (strain JEL423) TaxID=403673 RepID=A0A177WFR2_BATDL|nr:hypothetical protein BDEG_22536 [Batrachochytrium dendrobatidis JEL423]